MNDNEDELMTKAWRDWFTFDDDDDIPEVSFTFEKAWKHQHKRYNLLIDSYEKIIKAMQVKIDRDERCSIKHPKFCTCMHCTVESPELF